MTIKAGDLVMVVRTEHCGCGAGIGSIFRVARLGEPSPRPCRHCGEVFETRVAVRSDGAAASLFRLKKIDPLSEPERVERDEQVPA